MIDLFSVPWSQVEFEHVRAFLDDAGEEGVTWEAKADDDRGRLRTDSIRKAACGLANQIGGYLIVGARHDDRTGDWSLPGIAAPDDEPELWIGKVLRSLQPVPRFEAKSWPLDAFVDESLRRHCTAPRPRVRSARRPRSGRRVSGETLPVQDPALLDRLFRRGENAHSRARQFAVRAAQRALDAPRWKGERSVGIAVALASVGRETDDISSRLFVKPTRDAIAASAWAVWGGGQPDDLETWQQQDAYSVLGHFVDRQVPNSDGSPGKPMRSTSLVQGTWDGAVAASATMDAAAVEWAGSFEAEVRDAWRQIAALVDRLGGHGPAHLAIVVAVAQASDRTVGDVMDERGSTAPPRGSPYARLPEATWMARTVSVGEPSDDVIASLARELNRAAGVSDDEPDSEPE